MGNKPITIKDIARELNLSPSTVSRALRNFPGIAQETIDQVRLYANQHHYNPNAVALSMQQGKTNIIGVIVPQVIHFFFSSVIDGMESVAEENGYSIILCQSNESYESEVKKVHTLLSLRVCGILCSLSKETKLYDHFQEVIDCKTPLIFFDRICTGLMTDKVVVDDYNGAYSATEYLIKTGCKRIAYYGAPLNMEIAKNRRNGYIDALLKHQLPVDPSLIYICDDYEGARHLTDEVLKKEPVPDAFFAVNDQTASGIMKSVKRAGYRVPQDISICGFSDGHIAQNTDPQLTTVNQHAFEVGEAAMQMMIKRVKGEKIEGNYMSRVVKTQLVIRESTRNIE